MEQLIQTKLELLEQEYDLKVLYAVESGSRAWGFESKNSDWDVRFIYKRPVDYYLKIHKGQDSLDKNNGLDPHYFEQDLDFAGWDLSKALFLLHKGNPPLSEWLRSPFVYKEDTEAVAELRELATQFWSPKSAIYHYVHMAERNYNTYVNGKNNVELKKYLYILRPLLCCDWIERYRCMAPMQVSKLTCLLVTPYPNILKHLEDLLVAKKAGQELGVAPKIDELNTWIEDRLKYYGKFANSLTATYNSSKLLDEYMVRQVLNG